MFAKQLLNASLSRCIIQESSYNATVSSHVKLVKQTYCLEMGEKEAAEILRQHLTHTVHTV